MRQAHQNMSAILLFRHFKFYTVARSEQLRKLRFKKYMVISGRVNFYPENLAPTEQVAYFHRLRVFHQIMEWRFLSDGMKNTEEWSWKKMNLICFR